MTVRPSRCALVPAAGLALILVLSPTPVRAQQSERPAEAAVPPAQPARATYIPNHADLPTARAVRTDARLAIDGILDEPEWMSAPVASEFWQYDPAEGVPISERTEVRLLYDDDALYVGVWLWDKDIRRRLARRDGFANDTDIFAIYLDSYHDHRTAYRFAINASGWRRDLVVSGGGGLGVGGIAGGDVSWDPVWEVKTAVADDRWFVEMRIPFSQLRFSPADEQVWGLQMERKIRPVQEETIWSWTPSTEAGGVGRFGHLLGIRGIKPGRRLEALPYFGGRAEYLQIARNPDVGFDDPFRSDSDYSGTGGIDMKYRLTSNFTLDATLNPDFGQVEVDPAVINLSAFETRFAERRPFFVEGAETFDFGPGGPSLVYSRRVGRSPQGEAPAAAVYSLSPGATTILGAGKLTGKSADGWSMGVLDAVTARERASWLGADRVEGRSEIEPLTNYFAGRVRRELRSGQTVIGVLATAVNRSLDDSPLEPKLHAGAYSGGVDVLHQWANRIWELQAHVSPSFVSGGPTALVATQRTSSRYFQRPDAFRVDSLATSLTGYSGRASVAKRAGLYRMSMEGIAISPGYEVNDLGFQTDAGRLTAGATGAIEHTRPGPHLRNWSVRASGSSVWNYDGDRVGTDAALNINAQLLDLSRARIGATLRPEALNDRLTRGGPLALSPTTYTVSADYDTDTRTTVSGGGSVSFGGDASGGSSFTADVNAAARPSTTLEIQLNPRYSRSYTTAQYLSTATDPTAVRTFGRRYLFAGLRQTTVALTTRLNAIFSPRLSLELYAEPFISSGRYDGPKELAAARTFDFFEYGKDVGTLSRTEGGEYRVDPDGFGPAPAFQLPSRDFNFRSLQGNAVFRWEWRPGSTLFLVWQQSRSARVIADALDSELGEFDFSRDADALFRIRPDNIFLVKVSYWLNP